MRIATLLVAPALFVSGCSEPPAAQDEIEEVATENPSVNDIVLETSDGGQATGTFYWAATEKPIATLLLLHQARGDGRGEYYPIVEEFTKAGFDLFLLDQRSGGDLFGGENRTAKAYDQEEVGYCDAIPDVDAAIDWLAKRKAPLFVAGSSYSAALAVRAADVHADKVAGFVAFSPASGEPMAGCDPSEHMAAAPRGYVLRPASEMEIERVTQQLADFDEAGAQTLVVENGVHGASMMVDERTEHDMSAVRQAVIDFIRKRADQSPASAAASEAA